MTSTPDKSKSYGTLSSATPTPSTPTLINGRNNSGMSRYVSLGRTPGGEDEDEVIYGEGEFEGQVDDRPLWMRRGRQGKATITSSVTK